MTEFNSGRGGRDDDIVDLEAQPVNATGNSAEGSSREPIKQEPLSGTVTVAHIVYCLHSISILIGLLTCKSSKDHSKPRNEVDTSLKSPV